MGSRFSADGYTTITQTDTIDNVCGGDKVTFIKLDVEGSEREALLGAKTVIRRDKPRLCVCVYHKKEDLLELPFLIKELVPEYKLYLRHHYTNQWETVLYAVMPE